MDIVKSQDRNLLIAPLLLETIALN